MTRKLLILAVAGCVSLILSGAAEADLVIDWFTVDGGGHTYSTCGAFSLGGTCGQSDAGHCTGATFGLSGGFWLGGQAASSVPELPPESELPRELRVVAGLANPFRDRTYIQLELPLPQPVQVRVFDHSGRLQRHLHAATLPAGRHQLSWDGRVDSGQPAASGVYLLQVRVGRHETRSRVVLLR